MALSGKAGFTRLLIPVVLQNLATKNLVWAALSISMMSGVSQMLPFVISGRIMIAMQLLAGSDLGIVPKDQLSNLGSYEIAAQLNQLVGSLWLHVSVLAGCCLLNC